MEDQSSFVVGAVPIQWTLTSTLDAFRKKDIFFHEENYCVLFFQMELFK